MGNKRVPEIRFAEFTGDWEQRKLGEVIDNYYNGQTPSRSKAEFWNGKINWLSSGELNRAVVSKTIEKITEAGKKSANLKVVPKGTFVIAITGLEAAGTRGNCARLGVDTTLNQSCMALFPNKKILSSGFLFQWYRKYGQEYGIRYTQGTKQQSYNAELLKILPITLPNVKEQILISDFLDKLDDTIALHQQELETLKQTKQGFLQKMFPKEGKYVPDIRFSGFIGSWKQKELSELGDILTGSTPRTKDESNYSKDGLIWVTPTDINSNIVTDTARKLSKHGQEIARIVPPGTILVTCIASIGKNALVKTRASFNQQINSLTPNEFNDSYFLLTQSEFWSEKMRRIAATGTMQIVNKSTFSSITVLTPSLEEQQKIGNFFKQLDETIALHEQELETLKQTKKAFLQKMFI